MQSPTVRCGRKDAILAKSLGYCMYLSRKTFTSCSDHMSVLRSSSRSFTGSSTSPKSLGNLTKNFSRSGTMGGILVSVRSFSAACSCAISCISSYSLRATPDMTGRRRDWDRSVGALGSRSRSFLPLASRSRRASSSARRRFSMRPSLQESNNLRYSPPRARCFSRSACWRFLRTPSSLSWLRAWDWAARCHASVSVCGRRPPPPSATWHLAHGKTLSTAAWACSAAFLFSSARCSTSLRRWEPISRAMAASLALCALWPACATCFSCSFSFCPTARSCSLSSDTDFSISVISVSMASTSIRILALSFLESAGVSIGFSEGGCGFGVAKGGGRMCSSLTAPRSAAAPAPSALLCGVAAAGLARASFPGSASLVA
mmetsp:Transcript_9890/g.27778  ORF Transcript_9890/g.27778 Transcript_9890/m.27778 type:complete len:374 (-) Transcript_9890:34-1155(-)